jgi:hypothetical protein
LGVSLFVPTEVQEADAAGFFVTPRVVQAGEPFRIEIATVGSPGAPDEDPNHPANLYIEGTEMATMIRINRDTRSATPGNCNAVRVFLGNLLQNLGKDWDLLGPGFGDDPNWSMPPKGSTFPNECSITNGLGPGDYIVSLEYLRAIGDGRLAGATAIDVPLTVASPAKLSITPTEALSGGSVQFTIDMAGSSTPGTYATTATSLTVNGPCTGTYSFPDGDTAWGQDRVITFPSSELAGSCGNLGKGGTYQVQLQYRLRFPNGFIDSVKFLVDSFTVKLLSLNVIGAIGNEPALIGISDLIASGQYGEALTDLRV